MSGAVGSGSCTWPHFSLPAGLRGKCLMTLYMWGNSPRRSAAVGSQWASSRTTTQIPARPRVQTPGSSLLLLMRASGDSLPWVKYQNHLDGPVTDPAICHGWRQPSEASGPTLSHMGRTTGRQQGDQVEGAREARSQGLPAINPELHIPTARCGLQICTASTRWGGFFWLYRVFTAAQAF